MPVSGSAARRYAEAILELAPDEPSVAALRTSLERIASALDRSAIAALRDPAIPLATREKALGEAVKDEPVLIRSVLSLLIEHGRIALVPAIAREFGEIVDAREGVAKARVTTAVELNDRDRDALVRRLERARRPTCETASPRTPRAASCSRLSSSPRGIIRPSRRWTRPTTTRITTHSSKPRI